MNKNIKRLLLLTVSIPLLGGCTSYHSSPGKIEDLEGTYKLTTITKRNENDEDYSYKSQQGIEAYFSFSRSGYGYYVYKDKNTDYKVTAAYFDFVKDDEKEDYYKAIEITDGIANKKEYECEVGCMDEPIMGFNLRKKTFSYTIHHHDKGGLYSHEIPYQYVEYKKVSKATDLSTINKQTGKNFTVNRPFEMNNLHGYYVGSFDDSSNPDVLNPNYQKFDYAILDMESFNNNTLTAYYALKEDHVAKQKSVQVNFVTNSEGKIKDVNIVLDFANITVSTMNSGTALASYLEHTVWSEMDETGSKTQYYADYFTKYFGDATTLNGIISELTAN